MNTKPITATLRPMPGRPHGSLPPPEWQPLSQSPGFEGPMAAVPKMAHQALAKEPSSLPLLPLYIRLPRSGTRDQLFNLGRSALNALILPTAANDYRPPVRSVVLKGSKHATRGCRMIVVESLRSYLQSLLPEDPGTEDRLG